MKVKMLPPRRFPMHDGRTITALTQKNIPFKTEHKRQSVKIKNPRSSWTMALSRSIITQAIHHQPPIKAKYNNYFVLRGRAPPRYVSSVHVRTVSNFDGKFLLHRRRYTNAALKNAGKKLMWQQIKTLNCCFWLVMCKCALIFGEDWSRILPIRACVQTWRVRPAIRL